ncbi:hypothetical protein ACS0TY_023886 [Phlomoides rotata]
MESEWSTAQQEEGVPPFVHIKQNEFLGGKQKKLKEEDIAVCECKYDPCNPESGCAESCLNVLTNTECTPEYCPCGQHCRNQKFQKCEYATTKLFKTEGRGWGLLADQSIKAGEFIIEYCGELISSEEAKQRSHTYEAEGLIDAYIISLDANYFIDATRKGSLARFINHSCQPNCETRKWTVLGETRVGIFAKHDIAIGTELAYDYNFEWYGGANVRCLCGAANCSLFLGAKSQGFQEYNHVWEDGDDRYTVEDIPLYDSAEDEPFPKPAIIKTQTKHEPLADYSAAMETNLASEIKSEVASGMKSNHPVGKQDVAGKSVVTEKNDMEFSLEDRKQVFSQTNAMISRIRSNSACRNYNIGPGPSSKKRPQPTVRQKPKTSGRKNVSSKPVAELFVSKKAQEEIRRCEELKNKATSELNSLYDEIRPAIEEHERDSQDSVPTSVAEKWIEATCSQWKAEFDFHFSIIKNVMCPPPKDPQGEAKPSENGAAVQSQSSDLADDEDVSSEAEESVEEEYREVHDEVKNQANDDVLGREIVMDYTNVFTTLENFASRDALLKWVHRVGKENNIVIVVKRSDNGAGKKKARVFLACERGGAYRSFKGRIKAEGKEKRKVKKGANVESYDQEEESSKAKETSTKKCGCSFLLKGTEVFPSEWILEVKCGTHNHPITTYLEGHSYAGRLSVEEEEFVIGMSKCNAPPRSVLKMLKRKSALNHSTIRTIYNARKKHKVSAYCGRTQLQYLMSKLVDNQYFQYTRSCQKTNTLKELFFAHPVSIQLLRAFPKVLFIDCTYKTNRYRLPYFEIVGVTSTGMTFTVGSVYLEAEKEDNYAWALGVLRDLLGDACLPTVFITDLENALMNALASKFPESRHFLCTWNINRDVLTKCKGDFTSNVQWEAFYGQFTNLMFADSEKDFEDAVRVLHSDFATLMKPVKYVMNQWINPYKERFVKAWTNQVMHYGNITTNRVENHHSALKRMLGNSLGNFETSWLKIDTLFEECHTAIKHSFEKSVNITQDKFSSNIYNSLRGVVSIVALEKLFDEVKEIKKAEFDPSMCKHILRKVYGLPCAHELDEYVRTDKPIPINVVDALWKKLDMEPMVKDDVIEDIDHRFSGVVDDMVEVFKSYDQSQRLIFLRHMRELVNSVTTDLVEPSSQIHTRGSPKAAKKGSDTSTKRDPNLFKYQQSLIGSCTIDNEIVVYDVSEMLPSPMFENKVHPKKQPIFRKLTRLDSSGSFINLMPDEFQPYIVECKNVKGDGHCGFRAVAALMGFGEESWVRVRQDLMNELTHNLHLYQRAFRENDRVKEVLDALNCFTEFAPFENWFLLPYMGYLVASAYNVAFITLDTQLSLTFLPLKSVVPERPRSICMGIVNRNHFVQVLFGAGRPLPPIASSWTDHHHPIADGWLRAFETSQIS